MASKKIGQRYKSKPRDTCTPRQKAFIAEYVTNGGQKAKACRALKIPYDTVMDWFSDCKPFQREIEQAESSWYDALRATMLARAHSKSDTLLIFALKARHPELYDDNIRALNWRQKQLTEGENAAPPQITFERDVEPDRLKLVEPERPKLLNGTNGHASDKDES